jgi:thiamine pyrophosphokinase
MMTVIFSGGEYRDLEYYRGLTQDAGLVIAADSGGGALLSLGVAPDILVGDMDSIGSDVFAEITRRGAEVIEVPPEKDFTDSELAVRTAIDRGADEIVICGALGDRLDHTLANISLLVYAQARGINARIVTEDQEAWLLTPDVVNPIPGKVGDTLSLIALSDPATGVTTHDLKYPLREASLTLLSPLGVSNEISGTNPFVEFWEGLLLLVLIKNP